MAESVFLSYRRDDSEGQTGRLYDRLNLAFPGRIFLDLSGIDVGVNFEKRIVEAMQASAVCIVVIGRSWATITNKEGQRRLFQPNDYVRFEVRTALERGLQILPVLVDNAEMPATGDLPPDLHALPPINAICLLEAGYDYMVDKLIARLETIVGPRAPKYGDLGGTIETLRRRAQVCGAQDDWTGAIQLLQAAISMNPANGEVARELRNAQQQLQLSGLYADAQRRLQTMDRPGALERFRQIRDMAGAYRDTLALIASLESGPPPPVPPPPSPPKPGRKRGWLIAIVSAVVVLGIIVAMQNDRRPPEPGTGPERLMQSSDEGPLGQPANAWLLGAWQFYPESAPAQTGWATFYANGQFTYQNQWGYFNGGGQYAYSPTSHSMTLNGAFIPVSFHKDHFHLMYNGAVWALRR